METLLTHNTHPAAPCYTLQRTAMHCSTLQHTATHCNALQHTATLCNALQHSARLFNTLQHSATLCNTLQHTATHCNTVQHSLTWNTLPSVVHTHTYTLETHIPTQPTTDCSLPLGYFFFLDGGRGKFFSVHTSVSTMHTHTHIQDTHTYTHLGIRVCAHTCTFTSICCSVLQCGALQHSAPHCNTLQHMEWCAYECVHTCAFTPLGRAHRWCSGSTYVLYTQCHMEWQHMCAT